MTGQECLAVIESLAKSQGSYGRMFAAYNEMSEQQKEEFLDIMEGQNFSDPVDLILFIES